jgi:hypothetical protein
MGPYRSSRPRNPRRVLSHLQFTLTSVARPNPVVIVWRWRYELGLLIGVPAAVTLLMRSVGIIYAVVILAALVHLIVLWPPARRLVMAQAWCVITAHRVRTGCAQAWIHSRNGKIPVVLLTRHRPYGEGVLLWCRAGTSPEDFALARRQLAAACWARDVRLIPSERFAHLVQLDVIRQADWPWPDGPAGPSDGPSGPRVPPEMPPTESGNQWLPINNSDNYPCAA